MEYISELQGVQSASPMWTLGLGRAPWKPAAPSDQQCCFSASCTVTCDVLSAMEACFLENPRSLGPACEIPRASTRGTSASYLRGLGLSTALSQGSVSSSVKWGFDTAHASQKHVEDGETRRALSMQSGTCHAQSPRATVTSFVSVICAADSPSLFAPPGSLEVKLVGACCDCMDERISPERLGTPQTQDSSPLAFPRRCQRLPALYARGQQPDGPALCSGAQNRRSGMLLQVEPVFCSKRSAEPIRDHL